MREGLVAVLERGGIAVEAVAADGEQLVRKRVSIYRALGLPPSPDDHRRVLAVTRYLRSAAETLTEGR